VYSHLFTNPQPDSTQAAYALHYALKAVQKSHRNLNLKVCKVL
jgi:hypothetical protein